MSVGRVLDNTFRIYRDNFIRFITIVAVFQVPIALLKIISTSHFQDPDQAHFAGIGFVVAFILAAVLLPVFQMQTSF